MFYLYLSTAENGEEYDTIRALYEDGRAFFINIAIKITKDPNATEEIVQDAFIKESYIKKNFSTCAIAF